MRYDRGMEPWPSRRREMGSRSRYDAGFRRGGPGGFTGRGMHERAGPGRRGYAPDYWWLGEREMERQGYRGSYDEAYRRFSERYRPRHSPVGGMYQALGGRYASRPPRELREPTWFSDWTRWF